MNKFWKWNNTKVLSLILHSSDLWWIRANISYFNKLDRTERLEVRGQKLWKISNFPASFSAVLRKGVPFWLLSKFLTLWSLASSLSIPFNFKTICCKNLVQLGINSYSIYLFWLAKYAKIRKIVNLMEIIKIENPVKWNNAIQHDIYK